MENIKLKNKDLKMKNWKLNNIFYFIFIKRRLCWCDSKKELNDQEKFWISYFRLLSNVYKNFELYNITPGGNGGDTLSKNPNLKEIRKKISKGNTGRIYPKERYIKNRERRKGKIWVTNEILNKVIDSKDFSLFKNKGYRRGKCYHSKEARDNVINCCIQRNKGASQSKETRKKNSDWQKNSKFINKDNVIKKVQKEDLQKYLDNGWNLGFTEEVIKKTRRKPKIK